MFPLNWVMYAGLTAVLISLRDVVNKLGLREVDPLVGAFWAMVLGVPFLLPWVDAIRLPALTSPFWWAVVIGGSLNVAVSILYMRALKTSDLSLSVPMLAFSPAFLLITSPLILGEFPSAAGVAGILAVVAGSYVLHTSPASGGLLGPFRAMMRESGPRSMLLVSFLWGIAANIDKIGLREANVITWLFCVMVFVSAGLLLILTLRRQWPFFHPRRAGGWFLASGALHAGSLQMQMQALSLTIVPNVIAVKRFSTVLCVIWGALLFGETGMRQRMPGALLMFAGVLLIIMG